MSSHDRPRHAAGRSDVDRRTFLKGLGAVTGLAAVGGGAFALDSALTGDGAKGAGAGATTTNSQSPGGSSTTVPASTTTTAPPGEIPDLPTAAWLQEENRRPGTTRWTHVGTADQGQLEGFADVTSATAGDTVTLYVNTTAKRVQFEIYRMGWYQGLGGRLVATLPSVAGQAQPSPDVTPGTNMVECHWQPTTSFEVDKDWAPGNYLIRLVGDASYGEWVPITIRDDRSTAAILMQNSVTTWQAYNLWGGYSLYYGQAAGGGQSYADRARVVSFDRPYGYHWAAGAADWLGNELPFLMLAERNGLDLAYATDIDLHAKPSMLTSHRCLVSLGHDEYWSSAMRTGVTVALAKGVNLAFLGANACYRHIRLAAGPTGPNRHQICYKDGSEDPLNGVDDAEVTWNWPDGPDPRPECEFIGPQYQSFGASGPMKVADPTMWPLRGTGLAAGSSMPSVIGSEFDAYVPVLPCPKNLDVVCHSPTGSVSGHGFSDVTWYTAPGGGGVFASGTAAFVGALWANEGPLPTSWAFRPVPGVTEPLTRMMMNVLAVLGEGPAHRSFPSLGNWEHFYSPNWAGVVSNDV